MINNSTPNETNIAYTKLRAGKYLATFTIKGIVEQVIISEQYDCNKISSNLWEIEGCIGWNFDLSDGDFPTLRTAKKTLAYYIASHIVDDADKTYGEPSADHKAFVKGMLN